jgi:hypothetical protein
VEGVGTVEPSGSMSIHVDSPSDFLLSVINEQGSRTYTAHVGVGRPRDYWLEQNFPNPFNPTTNIRFLVSRQVHVNLTIYDLLGRRVRTMVDEVITPGSRTIVWDGIDEHGYQQSSGTYFFRLTAGDFVETKRMILLK